MACPELQGTPPGLRGVSDRAFPPVSTELGVCCHPRQRTLVLDGNPSARTPRKRPEGCREVSSSPCPISATGRGGSQVAEGRGDSWQGDTLLSMPLHWLCQAQQWACARRGHWPCPQLEAASALVSWTRWGQGEGLQPLKWAPGTVQCGCGGWHWLGRQGRAKSVLLLVPSGFYLPPLPCLCCSPPPQEPGRNPARPGAGHSPAVPVPHLSLSLKAFLPAAKHCL